jgi:signal transduction histidine kinase/DNA-binding response OmpR family regulator
MGSSTRVLYVDAAADPDAAVAASLAGERDQFTVTTATPDEALDRLSAGDSGADCIVSDHRPPDHDGLATLKDVRSIRPYLPFVLYTADGSEAVASEAIAAGVTEYVPRDAAAAVDTLAARIEAAIDRGRERYDGLRERDMTIELLRDLYDVTTDTELTFDEKVSRLLQLGSERLDLPYAFLSHIETDEGDAETGGTQRIVQSHGDHELLQTGESCPLSTAYCRKTIETDGLLAIADAVDAGWETDPAYELFGLGSYIGGKVSVEGDLYGTLCFASTDPRGRPFTEAEQTLVRLISRWASYELDHDRMTSELQRQNDRLEGFASVLAHDLRNPLNVAEGRLELAQAECDSEDLEEAADALERISSLIEEVLTLAREGQTVTDSEWIDLSELVTNCWGNVATADARLRVETDRRIRGDPGRLKRLVENLVRNSIEHAGSDVTITVGSLEDGFFVEDDGPGIPPSDHSEIFEFGYTTDSDGTGYGLAIAKEIVEAHGWTVTVADGDDGGARFEIRTSA